MRTVLQFQDCESGDMSAARALADRAFSRAAGAVRISDTISAAFTSRRARGPVEARIMIASGILLMLLAVLCTVFPCPLVYPPAILLAWIAIVFLYRGYKLYRQGRRKKSPRRT